MIHLKKSSRAERERNLLCGEGWGCLVCGHKFREGCVCMCLGEAGAGILAAPKFCKK